ncbi:MAG: lipid-A-disaccharide synthase [Bacteroidota bacterium]|nr:lipid-A-disaccharide synthase [Bacteroidota bacterium]
MRLMIIAGEASGDLHGAGVVKELKSRFKDIEIFGIGGNKMQREGMQLVYHINELAVMGLLEVVKKLPTIRSVSRTLESLLTNRRPDAVLLIDYPGFNLRFAEKVRKAGIKIFYYISPQLWAWHPSRIKKMKGIIDKMFVVFPFEEEIYKREGIEVEFVGHPLLDVIEEPQPKADFCKRYSFDKSKPIIGLFPGSRKQELEKIFPPMLHAAKILETLYDAQIAVGVASVFEGDYIKSFLYEDSSVRLLQNATYDLMKNSDVAIVTSGTATLETACFQTPMVIVYKTSWLTYLAARLMINIKNIGLANIVAGKTIVPELIQHRANAEKIAAAAGKFLTDKTLSDKTRIDLKSVYEKLGERGAAKRVAENILKLIAPK